MKELRIKMDVYLPYEGAVDNFNKQKMNEKVEEAAILLSKVLPQSATYQVYEAEVQEVE